MCTRCGFPLVPVPTYLSTGYELSQSEVLVHGLHEG